MTILAELWVNDRGEDITEYAVMLATILSLRGCSREGFRNDQFQLWNPREEEPLRWLLPDMY